MLHTVTNFLQIHQKTRKYLISSTKGTFVASEYPLLYALLEIAVFVAFGAVTFWWSRPTKQLARGAKRNEIQ